MKNYKKTAIILCFVLGALSIPTAESSGIEKIAEYSKNFLGKPYINSPLGEGPNGMVSKEPLYRDDGFDCLTYIETVLALAISKTNNKQEVSDNLTNIRYKNGNISFFNRNHFPSVDWFPNNRWLVKDITRDISKNKTKIATATIDKQKWLFKNFSIYREIPVQEANIEYIDFADLPTFLHKIPNYSIITIVRQNPKAKEKIGSEMNVAHHGFLVNKDGEIFFRHASQIHKKITDENFMKYMNNYKTRTGAKGINVSILQK